MTTILLTGSEGQVGWELQRCLSTLGSVIACDRHKLDLTKPEQAVKLIRETRPTIIVNPAAFTSVDLAESKQDLAMKINGEMPGILAEEAKRLDSIFLYYSTDYIFDGSSKIPYTETDRPNPINVYGKSKLLGETNVQAVGGKHLIVRTSWVYGRRGKNFLNRVLSIAKEKNELKVVVDQIGAPTWSRLIAEATSQILTHFIPGNDKSDSRWGIYNLTSMGQTNWYKFAEAIFHGYAKRMNMPIPSLKPISSSEYVTEAKRPLYSVLSNEKLFHTFGLRMPDWEKGLELCLEV